jgi:hypothetical protein
MGWTIKELWFHFWKGQDIFPYFKASRLALNTLTHLFNEYWWILHQG